jgi:SAM-dependent methyltransferase
MKRLFRIKHLEDNRVMINLGCGAKMNWSWNNLDFSPYARLAHHMNIAKILKKVRVVSKERYQNLLEVDPNIILWDLRKGIPFNNITFDVVYHSHLLEHIDQEYAPTFLKECYRVLKSGGILRVVVPDLQKIIVRYNSAVNSIEDGDPEAIADHKIVTYELFDQMVRNETSGTEEQRFPVRFIERFIRGNAAKVGELHRWMYDKYSLGELLKSK